MKTIKCTLLGTLLGVLFLSTPIAAQEKEKEHFITATTFHWNQNQKDFSMDAWKATEKEYLDKVVKKNPYILSQTVLTHYFTADNTELILVSTYDSWDAIDKAGAKDDELVKAGWPDEKARAAFFDKKNNYYANNHSDEIYHSMPGAKMQTANFDKPMLYYVRKSVMSFPKDGNEKEFNKMREDYFTAVTSKNDFIKAYYPNIHAWGANKTDFTEVFVVESLGDIEKGFDKNKELYKATWNTDAKVKDYEAKMDKYFTGVHGDYIYRLVPELSK